MISKRFWNIILLSSLFLPIALGNVCERSPANGKSLTANSNIGQTFIAPITGNLHHIRIVNKGSSLVSGSAELYYGSVLSSSSAYLAQVSINASSDYLEADFTYAPVTAEAVYTVLITLSSSTQVGKGSYSNGSAVVDGVSVSDDLGFDFCFTAFDLENHFGLDGNTVRIDLESLGFDQYENIYLAGEYYGNSTLNGPTANYYPDGVIFIAKYDNTSEHNFLWSSLITMDAFSYVYTLWTNPQGYTALSGPFSGNITFPSGSCSANLLGGFLVLYDTDGNEMWHKCFANDKAMGYFQMVTIGNDSNVYFSSVFSDFINFGGEDLGNSSSASTAVAKYNLSGDHQWSVSYPTDGDSTSVVYDPQTNSVVIASCHKAGFAFDNSTIVPAVISKESLVFKLSASDGSYVWHQAFGNDSQSSNGNFADVDSQGNIIVTGYQLGNSSVGSVQLIGDDKATSYLVKFSSDGTPLWGGMYDGNLNLVNVGYQDTIFIIGDGSYSYRFGDNTFNMTAYMAALDSDGEFLWLAPMDVASSEDEYVWGLHTTKDSKTLIWAGSYYNNATIDGVQYYASQEGVFVHVYEGTYYENDSTTSDDKNSGGKNGLSTGALIGIIVGGVAALAILAAIFAYAMKKRAQNDLEMN